MSLWTKDFHPLGCLQPCTSSKRTLCKPYVCRAKGEKRAFPGPNHLCSCVGHRKSLLEESNLFQLVLERKTYYDHLEGIQVRPVNLLSSDVDLPNTEAKFLGVSGVHCVDFVMVIGATLVVMAILAVVAILVVKLSWLTILAIETNIAIENVMAIVTNMDSFQSFWTRTGYWIKEMHSRVARSSSH